MITSEKHAKAFLGGIERFVGKDHPELIPQVSPIMMVIYQEDLVTEDVLKSWGQPRPAKSTSISARARKCVNQQRSFSSGLETAESDEEEDSDDE